MTSGVCLIKNQLILSGEESVGVARAQVKALADRVSGAAMYT